VPLFALVVVLLWRWLGPSLLRPAAAAIVLAVLAEALQALVGRSADFHDLLRGVLGVGAGAAGIAAWRTRRSVAPLAGWLCLLGAALAWPLYDAVPYLIDAYDGARDFPTLAHFRTERELLRWRWRQADVSRVVTDDGGLLRVVFRPGPDTYPYAALRPIRRDLSGHRELRVSLTAVTAHHTPIDLMISLRSGSGAEGETTHYQRAFALQPGRQELRLNLAALAPQADPYPLDLADVWIIQFFLDRPGQEHIVDLHGVWLE
jgi:hypothetical protein